MSIKIIQERLDTYQAKSVQEEEQALREITQEVILAGLSRFAGKMHALLCREYVKGRDWYDFLWYCAHKTTMNTGYLRSALLQNGPWKGQPLTVTKQWWIEEIRKKIQDLDVDAARGEALRFVREYEQPSLAVWSKEFFQSAVNAYDK
ncbi:MAG TPA: hypothetical protein DEQ77_01415 [Candidatus Omnitrophica bacterium]|nr:hypothetical protein [Candidatus Omnitrophota bacterium]